MIVKSIKDNVITWKLHSNNNQKNNIIVEFDFLCEKNKIWLNNCMVVEDYRGKGIGKFIIAEAIKEFKKIYISSAQKHEHKFMKIKNDTRYIEDREGECFVRSLLNNELIHKEWYINPFI